MINNTPVRKFGYETPNEVHLLGNKSCIYCLKKANNNNSQTEEWYKNAVLRNLLKDLHHLSIDTNAIRLCALVFSALELEFIFSLKTYSPELV